MRCYKCQRHGHGKARCKKPAAVCVRCDKGDHVERDCSADPHCVNCRGDYAASSKTCPKFLKEQAILRYKAENGGPFQQVRKAIVFEIHKNDFNPKVCYCRQVSTSNDANSAPQGSQSPSNSPHRRRNPKVLRSPHRLPIPSPPRSM
ncbi:nucleic-acid-binding protein from mobile element jockey [Plakobranchus ocellatus]|uniref:Nucleic-acid-binding protein from mobile element jockey n=1 Tax=Plakobranchus ocellatus TaxID=259542 RepID=A0AAV4DB98_9GAST|nr:nucleic-acid-binding protein from mobile element jockey [Plakobranchus ocellatus]